MFKDRFGGYGFSVGLHVVILLIAFVTIGFNVSKPQKLEVNLHPDAPENQQIIKAGIIDKRAVDQAYARQALAEKQRLEKLATEKRAAEQMRQEAEQLKIQKEESQKALELANVKKAAAEAALVKAEADKAKAETAKVKALAEKTRAEAAAKKLQVAKDQAKLELAKKQAADKKASAMKAEQEKLQAQRDSLIMTEVQRYMAEIAASIEDNRILSSIFSGDIHCKIRIQLLPNGNILSASIVESSGNPAYDEMSQAAVYKSAPFPMPDDKEICNKLRDIVLSFKNGVQDVS